MRSCLTGPSTSVYCFQAAAVLNCRGYLGFVPLSAKHTSQVGRDLPVVIILSQFSLPSVPHSPQLLQRNPVQRYKEYHFEGRQNWLQAVAYPMRKLSRLMPLEPSIHRLLSWPPLDAKLSDTSKNAVLERSPPEWGAAGQPSPAHIQLSRFLPEEKLCLLHEAYIFHVLNCQPHCQYIEQRAGGGSNMFHWKKGLENECDLG